jgi:hypothetical protein
VLQAHHAGLAEAVGYLDEHLGARRGHGGVQHVSGQGLLAVEFDHRTSRESDPLLHTHLVVANRVQGPDGRWTALDGRDLYRHRLAADAIYRATYQRELVRTLGVEWTPADAHGNRELQGMPEALVRSFSKRTGHIDLELDRLVADGRERTPRLVKWAVQATRKPKQYEAPDTLYGRWRAEAAERGHDPDTLVREVTGRTPERDQDWTVSDAVAGLLFDRLAGPDGLTATASTFARPEVLVALGAGLAGAGRTELEELADRFLAERAVSVVTDRTLEERRWSTADLLAVEQRLVTSATGRTGDRRQWRPIRPYGMPWRRIPPPERISRRWSGTCPRAAKGSPWWSGGRGRARPLRWAWPGTPGSWTATDSWPRPRRGLPP